MLLGRIGAGARQASRAALNLLLPPTCLTCEEPVDATGRLCAECFRETSFVTEPCCRRCGVPFRHAAAGGPARTCRDCLASPPLWERARAALRYDTQSRKLVLPLKYYDRPELAAALAPMMVRAGAALVRDAELVVPVPLHRGRRIARRYNQAALLAHAVGRLAGKPVVADALSRTRATAPLAFLSAATRAETVAGAFAVRPHRAAALLSRRVLLIDDVLTTGATCSACADVMLEAGAAAVDVLVAARTGHARERWSS